MEGFPYFLMTGIALFYSFIHQWTGFHILAIVNNSAVNSMAKDMFELVFSFS